MARPKKKSAKAKKVSSMALKKKKVKKASAKNKKKITAVPKGYSSITPYLIIDEASAAIDFYKRALGAKEKFRMEKPDKKIAHAELQLGDSKIMLADECPEMNAHSPKKIGGVAVNIHFYTKKVDDVVERAVSLGAKIIRPVQDMFYGDRSGCIEDPYGHKWTISTHFEDVTPAKAKKRAAELYSA